MIGKILFCIFAVSVTLVASCGEACANEYDCNKIDPRFCSQCVNGTCQNTACYCFDSDCGNISRGCPQPVCYTHNDNLCGPGCSPVDQSAMRRLTGDWEGPTCKHDYDRGCIPAQWKNETVDVCNWPGASCIDQTNGKAVASVTNFLWSAYSDSATRITGTFSASNLPPNITNVDLSFQRFGTLTITELPSGVKSLVLNNIDATGSVDFTKLNSGLETLDVSFNSLTGVADLSNLPASMKNLLLRNNAFSTLKISNLPASLGPSLDLSNNQFSGTLQLSNLLAASIQTLDLSKNRFSGELQLSNLPASLQNLDLSFNTFTGLAIVNLPASLQNLTLSNNQFSGMLQLPNLPASLQNLDLSNNQFSGAPDLTKLPAYILTVDLRNNKFCGGSTLTPVTCTQLLLDPAVTCAFAYDGASLVTFPTC